MVSSIKLFGQDAPAVMPDGYFPRQAASRESRFPRAGAGRNGGSSLSEAILAAFLMK